jgi:DNA polymerase III delta prime subunit
MSTIVGQKNILKQIDDWVEVPRFILLSGPIGSGRRTVANYISNKLGVIPIVSDIKVDDVRTVIALSHKQSEVAVYLMENIDKMSPAAKNALLKSTEEPPRKAYFIMTVQDAENALATIKSRATILNMDPYTLEELLEYSVEKDMRLTEAEEDIVTDICNVPGELDNLLKYDILEFYNFINKVLDNIGKVTGVNAFKIANKLKFKEEDTGWDISLFMKAINAIAAYQMTTIYDERYYETIKITSKYMNEMYMTGINKQATFDMWILDMRVIWKEE